MDVLKFHTVFQSKGLSLMQDGSGSEMFDEESEFSVGLSDLEHVRVPDSSKFV